MKCLFSYANEYVKESDWKDLALVKFCLCATGVMIGLCIPKEKKESAFIDRRRCFHSDLHTAYDKISPYHTS